MTSLAELVASHEPTPLAHALQEIELESSDDLDPSFYAVYLLTLAILDRYPETSLLHARIPNSVQRTASIEAVVRLLTAIQKREYSWIYKLGSASSSWTPLEMPLVETLVQRTRERILALIESAYASLKLEEAGSYLGIGIEEVRELARQREWRVDGDLVFPASMASEQAKGDQNIARIAMLTQIAEELQYT